MATQNTWLDGMFDHAKSLKDTAARLERLGDAFMLTGNETMADALIHMGSGLREQADLVQSLTHKKVSDDLRDATQGAANVLKASLAGGELAGEDNQ